MKPVLLLALLTLTIPVGIRAQTTPAADELTTLLKEFLIGASRNDAAIHDRFWAEDLIYTGSAGRRRGKAEVMRDVRSAPTPKGGSKHCLRRGGHPYSAIRQYRGGRLPAGRDDAEKRKHRSHELPEQWDLHQAQRPVAGGELAVHKGAAHRRQG
jgi:hypothetical protein